MLGVGFFAAVAVAACAFAVVVAVAFASGSYLAVCQPACLAAAAVCAEWVLLASLHQQLLLVGSSCASSHPCGGVFSSGLMQH